MDTVKKVVLAYSGGLDTSIIIPWIRENYGGAEIVAYCGDVGQGDDLEAVRRKALATGATGRKRVGTRHLATFYSQLADLLHSGVPLLRSLDILERQASSAALKEVVREFRARVASPSGKMPGGCRCPVSACTAASASAMNTTSRPIGSWTFGWSGRCPLSLTVPFRPASAAAERRRPRTARARGLISSGWMGTKTSRPSRN